MTGSRSSHPGSRPHWVFLWGPVLAYALLIFALSSASDLPDLPERLSDKLAHVLLYSGLGFLLARALAGGLGRPVPGWAPPLVVLLAMLYGLSDEVHQLFVPRRRFDLLDLLADAVGAGLGAAAVWLWGILSRPGDAFR
ncbi:MAG TPA: VanZ family protein [Vicinamibacterales bacterium]|nr:VanZ family protein [Vicinamibacterales bacterium]